MAVERGNDGILGSLRSELDDSDTGLHKTFETLASLAGTVRTAYLSYRITPEKAGELLQGLRLVGGDGFEWTVGATSGAWFRRRTGEAGWAKAGMPIGIAPAPDQDPSWVKEGIATQLAAAENQMRDRIAEVKETEEQRDLFAEGSINPFQRKDDSGNSDPESGSAPRSSTTGGDVDWLFEEWEAFDRGRGERQKGTVTTSASVSAGTTGLVGRPALPKDLPADLDPDRALEADLLDSSAPVDRLGADNPGGGPEPRKINPEEFFLPPEE